MVKSLAEPEKGSVSGLGAVVQGDSHLVGLSGVEPGVVPGDEADTVQQSPCHVLETAEQFPERPPHLVRQSAQQATALQQLRDQESDLQEQVISFPLLRVDAVDMLQVQAAVLLAIEPFILDFPTI